MATAEPREPGVDDPLLGSVLAERYQIEALIGRGGMGAVYRARQLGLDRPVAIKVLRTELVNDPTLTKRFEREALSVSKLDHPNCVQLLDFGTTAEGLKYLVMQYLKGHELRARMTHPFEPERAVSLMAQVLSALEHAHRRGIVHRDLKPENVFVVEDDEGNEVAKLVDFGIVKLMEGVEGEQLTRVGISFGTPRYMSPEQATGSKLDARTDLYSAGVILYEMLAGRRPFESDDASMLLRMHMLTDPPPLPETVPVSLTAVVTRLLAKRPDNRYADAREARQALQQAVSSPADPPGLPSSPAGIGSEPQPSVSAPLPASPPLPVSPPPPVDSWTVAEVESSSHDIHPSSPSLARSSGTAATAQASVPTSVGATEPSTIERSSGVVPSMSRGSTPSKSKIWIPIALFMAAGSAFLAAWNIRACGATASDTQDTEVETPVSAQAPDLGQPPPNEPSRAAEDTPREPQQTRSSKKTRRQSRPAEAERTRIERELDAMVEEGKGRSDRRKKPKKERGKGDDRPAG